MSRLESAIRRLSAQRDCIDFAAQAIREIAGPVLEFGLGNGRTYDHLRERLPDRDIYVFDRRIAAHPACVPPEEFMFLGDIRDTLPTAAQTIGAKAALAHLDIGTGDKAASADMAAWLGPMLEPLLADGAIVVADQALAVAAFKAAEPPASVPPGRYFIYRVVRGT